jgi:hypothetical protein
MGGRASYLASMSLPGKIVLRPNEFSQPDYSVIYKDPDGRELTLMPARSQRRTNSTTLRTSNLAITRPR